MRKTHVWLRMSLLAIFVDIPVKMPFREKTINRSLKILLSSSRRESIISLMILIIRSFLPLAAIFLLKHYIDILTGEAGSGSVSQTHAITGLIMAVAITLLIDDLLSSLGQYISKKQSYLLENHIASLIHNHSATLGLRFFEDPGFYDKLSRAARDISWRPAGMVSDIILLLRGFISFIAMGYVLGAFGIIPLAVLTVVFLPVLWMKLRNSGRLYEARKAVTAHSRQASYFSWLLTGEKPAREVRLFGLAGYFEKLFRKHFAASKEPEIDAVRKNAILESAASVVKVVAFAGVLIYASFSYTRSDITAGELAMYIIAFRQALVYLRDAVSGYSGLAENRLFLDDLFHFLDLESDMPQYEKASGIVIFNMLNVENLTFTYPGTDSPALENINLKITKGEKVAIVGPNGSGKTTLAKLLCRLYDPDSGQISLNGQSIDTYDLHEYRKLFSVVFQDFMLYYLTAGDNIRLADNTGSDNQERLRRAASTSGVSSLLESLPQGYETMLGHQTGGSRELSWGEWQKIAIARALYRNSPVLILDEPSSSLDADSEYMIFSDLDRIIDGRTCIFISHRLANVRDADRIIVLDKGRIAEAGSHDELMAARGRYYSMFTRQKSMYR
jgi:ATP-binding cassette subfamily B protein